MSYPDTIGTPSFGGVPALPWEGRRHVGDHVLTGEMTFQYKSTLGSGPKLNNVAEKRDV